VTDLNQQTITRRAEFICHSSEFYFGLRPPRRVMTAGEALPIEVVVVDTQGRPWREPVKAQFRLQQIEWQPVRFEGAGFTRQYRSEPRLTNVLTKEMVIQPTTLTTLPTGQTIPRGTRLEGVIPPAAGTYLAEVQAEDDAGNEVLGAITFDVADTAALGWKLPERERRLSWWRIGSFMSPGKRRKFSSRRR